MFKFDLTLLKTKLSNFLDRFVKIFTGQDPLFHRAFFSSLGTVSSRFLAIIRESISAAWLGVSPFADAFALAQKFPSLLRRLSAEGSVENAALPIVKDFLARNKHVESENWIRHLLFVFLGFVSLCVIILLLTASYWTSILYPKIVGQQKDDFLLCLYILLPCVLCYVMCTLWGTVLHANNYFFVVSFGTTVGNMFIISCMLYGYIYSKSLIWAAVASACGSLAHLIWIYIFIRRVPTYGQGYTMPTSVSYDYSEVKSFYSMLGNALIGSGMHQLLILLSSIFAASLPVGSVTLLSKADRFFQLPISLLGVAIGTSMLTRMCEQLYANEFKQAERLYQKALYISMFLSVVIGILMSFICVPLMKAFFMQGRFSLQNVLDTARIFNILLLGLPAGVLIRLMNAVYFAHKDSDKGATPRGGAVVQFVVDIVCTVLFIFVFKLKAEAIALATAISLWANVFYLIYMSYKCKFSLMPCTSLKEIFKIIVE